VGPADASVLPAGGRRHQPGPAESPIGQLVAGLLVVSP
jgi:hypothetical protein